MGSKLYENSRAEQEADQVGSRFMDSSDVVGDMSRTYGVNLSSVQIHTDDAAARRVAETGADALSTGSDIFFGKGVFNQNDPASRGLLAHELTHSMQQGVGGTAAGISQSAPVGAPQGGMMDWFRRVFSRKPKISGPYDVTRNNSDESVTYRTAMRKALEPQGMTMGGTTEDSTKNDVRIDGYRLGDDVLTRLMNQRHSNDPVNPASPRLSSEELEAKWRFLSVESRDLAAEILESSPDQLQTQEMADRVVADLKKNFTQRLRERNSLTQDKPTTQDITQLGTDLFRGDAIGEMNSFYSVLKTHIPDSFIQKLMDESPNVDPKGEASLLDENLGNSYASIQSLIEGDPVLQSLLKGSMETMDASDLLAGADNHHKEEMMMNTFMLRAICPQIVNLGVVPTSVAPAARKRNMKFGSALQRVAKGFSDRPDDTLKSRFSFQEFLKRIRKSS